MAILRIRDTKNGKIQEILALRGQPGSAPIIGENGNWFTDGTDTGVKVKDYVTPQMFGAVADGNTDCSEAIQNALDCGGIIYFPAGRYKVTSELKALKPCTIMMEGTYPSSNNERCYVRQEGVDGDGKAVWVSCEENDEGAVLTYKVSDRDGDYPLCYELDGDDYNEANYSTELKYGARIETYVKTEKNNINPVGLLLGDCVHVDGLHIRAMEMTDYKGIVLRYDGSQGLRTYPSQVRLRNIRVDCVGPNVYPESLFDFNPYNSFGTIVDDVILGTNHAWTYATYGWRTSLEGYAQSANISNIRVNTQAKYPFYIDTNGHQALNWSIHSIDIQTFKQHSKFENNQLNNEFKPHINLVVLKGLQNLLISNGKLWDVYPAAPAVCGVSGALIKTEALANVTAINNDKYFNELDTTVTNKIWDNTLTIKQTEDIISDFLIEKGAGYDAPGRNKFNYETERQLVTVYETIDAKDSEGNILYDEEGNKKKTYIAYYGQDGQFEANDFEHDGSINGAKLEDADTLGWGWYARGMFNKHDNYWITGLIPCGCGDTVRIYFYGCHNYSKLEADHLGLRKAFAVCEYDKTGAEGLRYVTGEEVMSDYVVHSRDAYYVRFCFQQNEGYDYRITYDDRENIMVTVNEKVDITNYKAGKEDENGELYGTGIEPYETSHVEYPLVKRSELEALEDRIAALEAKLGSTNYLLYRAP